MTGSSPIRILTVDDHPVVREGIAGLVGTQPDMTVAAEAANRREAIQHFRAHRPDVTLMDIQMPEMNGLDALLTEDTVKGRVKNILAKLDANDRTHAAIIGLKRGIIEL
jgi:DNA-binding NarL/FixJ family response regulator